MEDELYKFIKSNDLIGINEYSQCFYIQET